MSLEMTEFQNLFYTIPSIIIIIILKYQKFKFHVIKLLNLFIRKMKFYWKKIYGVSW